MFYQTDPQWKNEIMTHPKSQKNADLIGDYGCYVTCYANILKYRGNQIDPKTLNELIKNYKGYLYLYDPTTPINKASFLRVEVLEKLYSFKRTVCNTKDLKYEINSYYIGKILVKTSTTTYTHFINILEDLGNSKLCYDVYDGKTMKVDNDKFIDIYKIEFDI